MVIMTKCARCSRPWTPISSKEKYKSLFQTSIIYNKKEMTPSRRDSFSKSVSNKRKPVNWWILFHNYMNMWISPGHELSLQMRTVSGFSPSHSPTVLSLALQTTCRCWIPSPQVTEHCHTHTNTQTHNLSTLYFRMRKWFTTMSKLNHTN